MNNATLVSIGTIVYGLVIGTFGVFHFLNTDAMSGMVPGYMPGPAKIWVMISGAGLILAAISILINKYRRIACLLLALELVLFVLLLHIPAMNSGNDSAMGNLLKDTAMAAAALMIAGRSK